MSRRAPLFYCRCVGYTSAVMLLLHAAFLLSLTASSVFGLEPSFDVPVINVTVQVGDTATLPCSVDFLGDHKVVWTDQWSTLLTLDDRRIIDDSRLSIERPYTRDWNLHIRKTVYNDKGQYTCQINTNPVKTKTVMLIVLVPSKIINELSSTDKTVQEGETVTLVCNVTGVPIPEVTWYKMPNDGTQKKERLDLLPGTVTYIDSCTYTLKQTGIGTAGEVLIIHNVSRYCDGYYECVAYNNVDPAVTRQIKVFVEFAPEVKLQVKRIGQYVGMETILDCEIVAYPHGLMDWMKGEHTIDVFDKQKYALELYSGTEDSKSKTLSLRIKDVTFGDFGDYSCFAENYLGHDKESMVLYDYSINDKISTSTTKSILDQNIIPIDDPLRAITPTDGRNGHLPPKKDPGYELSSPRNWIPPGGGDDQNRILPGELLGASSSSLSTHVVSLCYTTCLLLSCLATHTLGSL